MEIYLSVFVFIFGTIIGSFLNVVALRFNTGMGVHGRSQCFSCGYTLTWHDLIPVFSFLAYRGKCRSCKSPISYQYPLVESLMGVLFVLLFWKFSYSIGLLVLHLIISSVLMVAVIYDLKHKVIPNILSYIFIILSGISLFFTGPSLLGAAGILISLPFWFIVLVSKETWMGGGDAKLAMGIGWLLGISQGISALILATWIGALVGIPLLFIKKKGGTIKRIEIPFAPFLILGMYIALFSGIDILYVNAFL